MLDTAAAHQGTLTELGLLLALHTSGLVFAVVLTRFFAGPPSVGAELQRLGGALARAADGFLSQEFRVAALLVGGLCSLSFALYSTLLRPGGGLGGVETGFWAAVGMALGGASACVVAKAAARLSIRASLRTLSAAERSLDQALSVSVRAGGAVALLVESVSVLGLALVFGLLFAMKGGFRLPADGAGALGRAIALLLPTYALGVAAAALVIERGGAAYHAASDVGSDLAGERDAGLEHDDARNPAVVADLVGDHVGSAVGRAVGQLQSASVANVTALILGLSVLEAGRAAADPRALALAAFPLVARAFGVVATAFGVMVVRTDDAANPTGALWRGQVTTAIISLGGLAGSALWLIGDPHWTRICLAGVVGLVAATLSAHYARVGVHRRVGPLRELVETARVAEAPAIALGFGAGSFRAALPLLLTGLSLTAAWWCGASTGLPAGGPLGALTALVTMSASGPYLLALATSAKVTDAARGVSRLTSPSADAERRAVRLDEASFSGGAVATTYLVQTGMFATLVAASALPVLLPASSGAFSADLLKPGVMLGGVAGLALVLAFAGHATRTSTRAARAILQEVERQLRGFPRERGKPVIPADYTPSYKNCVELAARGALHQLPLEIALGLMSPIVLGVTLRAVFRSFDRQLPEQALVAFVLAAALTGLGAALSLEGARTSLAGARRQARRSQPASNFEAAVIGDAFSDLAGASAGPAAESLVKALAVVALAVAPFLAS